MRLMFPFEISKSWTDINSSKQVNNDKWPEQVSSLLGAQYYACAFSVARLVINLLPVIFRLFTCPCSTTVPGVFTDLRNRCPYTYLRLVRVSFSKHLPLSCHTFAVLDRRWKRTKVATQRCHCCKSNNMFPFQLLRNYGSFLNQGQ